MLLRAHRPRTTGPFTGRPLRRGYSSNSLCPPGTREALNCGWTIAVFDGAALLAR